MHFSVRLVLLATALTLGACGESSTSKPAASAASASENGIHEGDKAPAFSLESLNGQGKATIAPGKVTLVDFWATWCEPCKKSFPKYQELYVKYQASGLEIAAISVDDTADEVTAFAKEYGAKFPVAWDEGHKVAAAYEPENMPTAYLIGRDGVVKSVHRGFHEGDDAEIEKAIKELLPE